MGYKNIKIINTNYERDTMNIIIYIIILVSKIVENALSTVRLIVVANGKKLLGAILNTVGSIIWIFTAGIVIVDINKDLLKVFFFCLGSGIGSYVGSYIENKLALGNNLLMCIIDKSELDMVDTLRDKGYGITTVSGYGKDTEKYVLMIFTTRKKRRKLVEDIKSLNNDCMIISEAANTLYGGYNNS